MLRFSRVSKKSYKRLLYAVAPFLLSFTVILLAYTLGAFSLERLTQEGGQREFNAAFAIPIMTLYFWLAVQITKKRAIDCLTQFSSQNEQDAHHLDYGHAIHIQYRKNLVISIIIGSISTLLYLISEDLIAFDLDKVQVLLNVTAAPFWVFACLLVLQLIFITHFTIKHFLGHDKIDLFGIKKLMPVSEMVITNTLVSAFGLSLIPLFWIGKTIPTIDKAIVGCVFILMCCYLFWPVIRVQQVIANKKRLAIDRINRSFEHLYDDNLQGKRRLTDDPKRLRKLSALISAKQEIAEASEWPFSLPQSMKGMLLLFSLPGSWAAASFVETLISKLNVI